jgi:hypothetical protein
MLIFALNLNIMIKYTFFFFLFFLTKVEAQQIIELKNPSLEGLSASGVTPKSWQSWGFQNESEPDIQPNQFGVATEAHKRLYVCRHGCPR